MSRFTEFNLKSGMLVETRNGEIFCLINETLVNSDGFMTLDDYNYDLRTVPTASSIPPDYDIMKVSEVLEDSDLIPKYWTKQVLLDNLLWERNEETIKINGNEYILNDVLERIKALKPVSVNYKY
jgi:hypothetical protein